MQLLLKLLKANLKINTHRMDLFVNQQSLSLFCFIFAYYGVAGGKFCLNMAKVFSLVYFVVF